MRVTLLNRINIVLNLHPSYIAFSFYVKSHIASYIALKYFTWFQKVQNMVQEFFMNLDTDDNGSYHPHILPSSRFPRLNAEQLSHLENLM